MTENPNFDEQVIHLEEDKSINNEDKFIQIEDKSATNEDKILNIEERINAENIKAEKLLMDDQNQGQRERDLNNFDNMNNINNFNMDLELGPKQDEIHDFNNKGLSISLTKNKKNDNINYIENLDNHNHVINNIIGRSHSNRSGRSNKSNRNSGLNINNPITDINDINNEQNNGINNNINNKNDINIENLLTIRNKMEEEKEKEKVGEKSLDKTNEEVKALLSSTSNKEQLNDLIEILINDKDFMKEFLMMEKKNSNNKESSNGEEEKKDEDKINAELEQDKNVLSNKDFETIYKELHEEDNNKERKQLNGNYLNDFDDDILLDEDEEKNENEPYNKICKLIKKNGINRVFNILVDIFNKSDTNYKFLEEEEIKEEITEITKTIRKDVLFIYLMKIICNNTMPPLFPSPMLQLPQKNNINNNSDLSPIPQSLTKKELYTNVTKYEKAFPTTKKKVTGPVDFQYHSRHFHWKHGKLYSYAPKNKMKASKCFLYCGKNGCEAKVQIDMNKKRATFIGSHNDHEGINIEKYAFEYPGLDSKDWKHIQYDCYNGKKILMWKY